MGKSLFMRKGEVHTAPVGGLLLSSLTEGQIVMIPENGALTPFYLAKHDYESGLNGTGRVLMVRKNCSVGSQPFGSSIVADYEDDSMDMYFNNTYLSLFSSELQEAIGTTTFYYTAKESSSSYLSTLSRAVFTLSVTEYGCAASSANIEGSALPISDMLLSVWIDDVENPKTNTGLYYCQWTRTPYNTYTGSTVDPNNAFYIANKSCGSTDCDTTTRMYYRPCFTLPSTMLVDTEPNADGSVNLKV